MLKLNNLRKYIGKKPNAKLKLLILLKSENYCYGVFWVLIALLDELSVTH